MEILDTEAKVCFNRVMSNQDTHSPKVPAWSPDLSKFERNLLESHYRAQLDIQTDAQLAEHLGRLAYAVKTYNPVMRKAILAEAAYRFRTGGNV